jgi:hypothetical protein
MPKAAKREKRKKGNEVAGNDDEQSWRAASADPSSKV